MSDLEVEVAAVADPGQTVFLRVLVPVTDDLIERQRRRLDQLEVKTGVKLILLTEHVEVARIVGTPYEPVELRPTP